jgi:2,3-bisphosphoglycerate-independent phosphoglycerate mutase
MSHKAIEVNREIDALIKSESSLLSVFNIPTDKKSFTKTSTTFTTNKANSQQPKIKSFREKMKISDKTVTGTVSGGCSIVVNNNNKNDDAFDIMEI